MPIRSILFSEQFEVIFLILSLKQYKSKYTYVCS